MAKEAARESRKRQKEAIVAAETKTVRTPPVKGENMYAGTCDERVLAKGQQHDRVFMCPHEIRIGGRRTYKGAEAL